MNTENSAPAPGKQSPDKGASQASHCDAPPQESELPDDSPPSIDTQSINKISLTHSEVERMQAAETINNNITKITAANWLESDDLLNEPLSVNHFTELEPDTLQHATRDLLVDQTVLQDSLERLQNHRVLVISGMAELGKYSFALKVLSALPELPGNVLVNHQLSPRIRCSLQGVARNKPLSGDKALVFEKSFRETESGFGSDVSVSDEHTLASLSKRLARQGSYLVFTADSGTLPLNWQHTVVNVELHKPEPDDLRDLVIQRLNKLGLASLDEGALTRLLEQFDTPAKIASFINHYGVALTEGDIELEQAIVSHERPENWFLDDLPRRNRNAWFLGLATLLAHASLGTEGVSSLDAHTLAHGLRRHFLAPERDVDFDAFCLNDSNTLEAANLILQPGYEGRGSALVFAKPQLNRHLWGAVLHHGHALLANMMPLLIEWSRDSQHPLQLTALACLGRCAEMEPRRLTMTILQDFLQRDLDQGHEGLSAFLRGTLNSGNDTFKRFVLRAFRERSRQEHKISLFFLVLGELGPLDPELAIHEYHLALRERFNGTLKEIEDASYPVRALIEFGDTVGQRHGFRPLSGSERQLFKETWIRFFLEEKTFSEKQLETLLAATHMLSGLSVYRGVLDLAARFKQHWNAQPTDSQAITALIWLDSGGVFDLLNRWPLKLGSTRVHRVVVNMRHQPESINELVDFLTLLLNAGSLFPNALTEYLRLCLFNHLKIWARSAVKHQHSDQTIRDFFQAIRAKEDTRLWPGLRELLTTDTEFSRAGSRLNDLARSVVAGTEADLPLDSLSRSPDPFFETP